MASKLVFSQQFTLGAASDCMPQLLKPAEANQVSGLRLVQCCSLFPGKCESSLLKLDPWMQKGFLLPNGSSSDSMKRGQICREIRAFPQRETSNSPKATIDPALQSMRETVQRQAGNLEDIEDKILLRFLRSNNQNVDEAARKFIRYQNWRKSFLPLGYVSESTIASELRLKQSYLQGRDKKGHPILVTFASKHETGKGNFEEYKRFLVYSFEKTLASAPKGLDKFITIMDLKKMGFKNLDSAAFIAAFQILQDYYPGTLEKAYMINAPFIFHGLWKIISPFLEEATRNNIVFLEGHKLKQTLLNQIDHDQLPRIYGGKSNLVLLQDAVISN